MTDSDETDSAMTLPEPSDVPEPVLPNILTKSVWLLWLASAVAAFVVLRSQPEAFGGLFRIDGLTVVMWLVVTFLSGIVHSYSRRYMEGDGRIERFFMGIFGFTVAVMVLVAADHLAVFWLAWLGMGIIMADLIGHVRGWRQSGAARRVALGYFSFGSALLAVGLAVLWWGTGSSTVSGVAASVDGAASGTVVLGGGALVLAAMVQSALLPFHGWLLSSMTAPTPASALMHAGFVNAGGILLTRFSSVFVENLTLMSAVVVLGASSAILGKLLKSVRSDVKGELGCSTVGQMGFMVAQAGLGFFGAAVTHLILHGFYKAYLFLSASGRVAQKAPKKTSSARMTAVGAAVTLATALAGGAVFAVMTGKSVALDTGIVLTVLIVLMVLHASRDIVSRTDLPATVRFLGVPAVFIPGIAVYATVFNGVSWTMADMPLVNSPYEITAVHAAVVAAFVVGYVAADLGVQSRSERLYAALISASQPSPRTVLTNKEEYNND